MIVICTDDIYFSFLKFIKQNIYVFILVLLCGAADTEQDTLFTFSGYSLQNGARVTRRRRIVELSFFFFFCAQNIFS